MFQYRLEVLGVEPASVLGAANGNRRTIALYCVSRGVTCYCRDGSSHDAFLVRMSPAAEDVHVALLDRTQAQAAIVENSSTVSYRASSLPKKSASPCMGTASASTSESSHMQSSVNADVRAASTLRALRIGWASREVGACWVALRTPGDSRTVNDGQCVIENGKESHAGLLHATDGKCTLRRTTSTCSSQPLCRVHVMWQVLPEVGTIERMITALPSLADTVHTTTRQNDHITATAFSHNSPSMTQEEVDYSRCRNSKAEGAEQTSADARKPLAGLHVECCPADSGPKPGVYALREQSMFHEADKMAMCRAAAAAAAGATAVGSSAMHHGSMPELDLHDKEAGVYRCAKRTDRATHSTTNVTTDTAKAAPNEEGELATHAIANASADGVETSAVGGRDIDSSTWAGRCEPTTAATVRVTDSACSTTTTAAPSATPCAATQAARTTQTRDEEKLHSAHNSTTKAATSTTATGATSSSSVADKTMATPMTTITTTISKEDDFLTCSQEHSSYAVFGPSCSGKDGTNDEMRVAGSMVCVIKKALEGSDSTLSYTRRQTQGGSSLMRVCDTHTGTLSQPPPSPTSYFDMSHSCNPDSRAANHQKEGSYVATAQEAEKNPNNALAVRGTIRVNLFATSTQNLGLPLSHAYANLHTAPSPVGVPPPSLCCRHHDSHDNSSDKLSHSDSTRLGGNYSSATHDARSDNAPRSTILAVAPQHDQYSSELARVSALHAARHHTPCSWIMTGRSALASIRAEHQTCMHDPSDTNTARNEFGTLPMRDGDEKTTEACSAVDTMDQIFELDRLRMRLLKNAVMRRARGDAPVTRETSSLFL